MSNWVYVVLLLIVGALIYLGVRKYNQLDELQKAYADSILVLNQNYAALDEEYQKLKASTIKNPAVIFVPDSLAEERAKAKLRALALVNDALADSNKLLRDSLVSLLLPFSFEDTVGYSSTSYTSSGPQHNFKIRAHGQVNPLESSVTVGYVLDWFRPRTVRVDTLFKPISPTKALWGGLSTYLDLNYRTDAPLLSLSGYEIILGAKAEFWLTNDLRLIPAYQRGLSKGGHSLAILRLDKILF